MTAEIIYNGELRTTCTHKLSGNSIITDAPPDNNGKGQAFSPTDLVATALGSCMITLMGIYANNHNLNIDGTTCQIVKVMASEPRRISQVHVTLNVADRNLSEKERKALEHVARNCPVAKSLHVEIDQIITINWLPQ